MKVSNNLYPSDEQMQGFFEGDVDTPISMVNLLKFKKHAEYEDGRNTQLSGAEAYAIYAEEIKVHLKKRMADKLRFILNIVNILTYHNISSRREKTNKYN